MKLTRSTIAIVLIFWTFQSWGQLEKISIGFEAGPSLTFLDGDHSLEPYYDSKMAFSGGLGFQYDWSRNLSVKTGISYERKGALGSFRGRYDLVNHVWEEIETHLNFDYLTFPLLAKWTFGKKLKFSFQAGPYFGYLTRLTIESKGFEDNVSSIDGTNLYKRFDVGLSLGIGIQLPITDRWSCGLEVRKNLGLKDVSNESPPDMGVIKMNSTNFLFGASYRLGKKTSGNP